MNISQWKDILRGQSVDTVEVKTKRYVIGDSLSGIDFLRRVGLITSFCGVLLTPRIRRGKHYVNVKCYLFSDTGRSM